MLQFLEKFSISLYNAGFTSTPYFCEGYSHERKKNVYIFNALIKSPKERHFKLQTFSINFTMHVLKKQGHHKSY